MKIRLVSGITLAVNTQGVSAGGQSIIAEKFPTLRYLGQLILFFDTKSF
jgi:hypothetical protein